MLNLVHSKSSSTPHKDFLIQMFNFSRDSLHSTVSDLDIDQLDYNFDKKSNSIGTLLKHIAALEFIYQKHLFENRILNEKERLFWHGAIPGELYLRKIKGESIQYYLSLLDEVRKATLEQLAEKDDQWLFSPIRAKHFPPLTNYAWFFHVIEDEMNHVGQIKMIKLRFS